jgi:hypothetical protein
MQAECNFTLKSKTIFLSFIPPTKIIERSKVVRTSNVPLIKNKKRSENKNKDHCKKNKQTNTKQEITPGTKAGACSFCICVKYDFNNGTALKSRKKTSR